MNCRSERFAFNSRRRSERHRGFSFTEIMFAVIILGVGFIMVAAIFPVAIQQAKSTSEETTAAAVARGAATYIGGVLTDGTGPGNSNCVAVAKQVSTGSGSIQVATVQQPGLTATGTTPALWDTVR